jgi:hypothetical protein
MSTASFYLEYKSRVREQLGRSSKLCNCVSTFYIREYVALLYVRAQSLASLAYRQYNGVNGEVCLYRVSQNAEFKFKNKFPFRR